ncbi:MAG: hypothetical protein A2103_02690 [Gammaproteobacteria bacterium GWF2_41_13]|nr:MAG: hypothetical protein A2103_02690 [Gammaproteobacteria bacterium GWF2_41_13]
MELMKELIEFVFSAALIINALLFIPQALRIFKEKSAADVSLLTFGGFLFIQLMIVLHGIINHDYLLIIGYLFSMVTCGAVVILTLMYKKHAPDKPKTEIDFKEILEQLPGHVYWKDKSGVCLGCNINNWRDFGQSSLAEFIGKTDYDLFPKEEADKLRAVDEEVMQSGQLKIAEEKLTTVGGNKTLFLSYKIPLKNKQGQCIGILGTSVDVTQATQEVEDQLHMLDSIIAAMPGNVYWMDRNGVYLGCNDNQAAAIGLTSRKEMIGKRNADIPKYADPKAIDAINSKVMETGQPILTEEHVVLPDGRKSLVLSNKTPLFNDRHEVVGLLGVSLDITTLREAEAKLLETEIKLKQQEERVHVLDMLGPSLAHELRTPLGAIDGFCDNLKYFVTLKNIYQTAQKAKLEVPFIAPHLLERIPTAFANIRNATKRANRYIDTLLAYIKSQVTGEALPAEYDPKNFHSYSINDRLDKILADYPFKDDEEKALIHWDRSVDFQAKLQPVLFEQVIYNIIKNAIYYINDAHKGEITLRAETGQTYNTLYIKDTSRGMSQETLAHIFEHFFSARSSGTGVGLALSKWAMETVMSGKITCHSVFGEFTEFALSFPVC